MPDWTSPCWTKLLGSCSLPVWLRQPDAATSLGLILTFFSVLRLVPFPTCERILSYSVSYLFQEGFSVKGYLAAVCHAQISLSLGDPRIGDMPQLEYFIKDMRWLSSGHTQAWLPITVDVLCSLRSSLEEGTSHVDGSMVWAAACMCFFGFLQSGEVVVLSEFAYDSAVHLSVGDVRLENTSDPKYAQVQIKSSKTDPFRHGVVI